MEQKQAFRICICLLLMTQVVGEFTLEIKLVNFTNPGGNKENGKSCDMTNDCDTEFIICVDHPDNSKHQADTTDQECEYFYRETEEIDARSDHSIIFGDKIKIKGSSSRFNNPMTVTSYDAWPGKLRFKADVFDDEIFRPESEKIDQIHSDLGFTPSIDRGEANTPHTVKLTGNRPPPETFLFLEVRIWCNDYFYGADCFTYCKQRDDGHGHYKCSKTGGKVCNEGYTGDKCTDKVVDKDVKDKNDVNDIQDTGKADANKQENKASAVVVPVVVALVAFLLILAAIILAVMWQKHRNKKRTDSEMQTSVHVSHQGQMTSPTFTSGGATQTEDSYTVAQNSLNNTQTHPTSAAGGVGGATGKSGRGATGGATGKSTSSAHGFQSSQDQNVYSPLPSDSAKPMSFLHNSGRQNYHNATYDNGPIKGKNNAAFNHDEDDVYENMSGGNRAGWGESNS